MLVGLFVRIIGSGLSFVFLFGPSLNATRRLHTLRKLRNTFNHCLPSRCSAGAACSRFFLRFFFVVFWSHRFCLLALRLWLVVGGPGLDVGVCIEPFPPRFLTSSSPRSSLNGPPPPNRRPGIREREVSDGGARRHR